MANRLIDRFGNWLGFWRGPAEFEDEVPGLIEMRISPHFEGELFQIDATSFDLQTGATRQIGCGLLAMGPDGLIRDSLFGDRIGFVSLTETPDDEAVLSLQGPAPGGMTMSIGLHMDEDELVFTSRVGHDVPDASGRFRAVARLTRIGLAPPERESP